MGGGAQDFLDGGVSDEETPNPPLFDNPAVGSGMDMIYKITISRTFETFMSAYCNKYL